jgi:hypothetical protein
MSQNREISNHIDLTLKIFTDPVVAFQKIKAIPHWVFPVLITFLTGYAFTVFTHDIQLEMQKSLILESERISENMKDDMLDNLENPTFFSENIAPVMGVAISTFFIPLIIGAVFMLFGNFVYGGSVQFNILFSSAAWAGLIGVLEMLIKLPLVINNGTMEVYTSLALLMDLSESKTFFFRFLNIFDIFTVWKVIVYSTAFMVVYNFSKVRSYTTIILLTLISSFIFIWISQLFF